MFHFPNSLCLWMLCLIVFWVKGIYLSPWLLAEGNIHGVIHYFKAVIWFYLLVFCLYWQGVRDFFELALFTHTPTTLSCAATPCFTSGCLTGEGCFPWVLWSRSLDSLINLDKCCCMQSWWQHWNLSVWDGLS